MPLAHLPNTLNSSPHGSTSAADLISGQNIIQNASFRILLKSLLNISVVKFLDAFTEIKFMFPKTHFLTLCVWFLQYVKRLLDILRESSVAISSQKASDISHFVVPYSFLNATREYCRIGFISRCIYTCWETELRINSATAAADILQLSRESRSSLSQYWDATWCMFICLLRKCERLAVPPTFTLVISLYIWRLQLRTWCPEPSYIVWYHEMNNKHCVIRQTVVRYLRPHILSSRNKSSRNVSKRFVFEQTSKHDC